MQQVNFSPLDFSDIRRQDDEARRRKYEAWGNIAQGIGKGIADTADRWSTAYQQQRQYEDQQRQAELAEQWRQRNWQNQLDRQAIQDARYNEEQSRLRSDRLNKAMAMTNLRKDFLSRYGGQDLSGYGLGAQFAMSRIQNPASYEDLVGAGQSLATIIAQQDMINAQRAEQAQANLGQNYSLGLNTRLGLMGFDPSRPEQSVAAVPTTEGGNELQGYLNNLQRERMGLEGFIRANPDRVTPEMMRQYNDIRAGINATVRRMHPEGRDWSF